MGGGASGLAGDTSPPPWAEAGQAVLSWLPTREGVVGAKAPNIFFFLGARVGVCLRTGPRWPAGRDCIRYFGTQANRSTGLNMHVPGPVPVASYIKWIDEGGSPGQVVPGLQPPRPRGPLGLMVVSQSPLSCR